MLSVILSMFLQHTQIVPRDCCVNTGNISPAFLHAYACMNIIFPYIILFLNNVYIYIYVLPDICVHTSNIAQNKK